jgi:cell division topological specificity factor
VFDFLKSLFKPAPSSGETAKERLRLVLLSDHLSLAPEVIESLKRDLLEVISRYLEIDSEHADVTFEQREREVAMLASIPITAVRDRPRPSPELPFSPEPLTPQPHAAEPPPPEPASVEPSAEPQVVAEKLVTADAVPRAAELAPDEGGAPELEFARVAAAKPKPARSGNAAGTRRRRRKKYTAAAAKANHAPPQSLGGQASAQG